MSCEDVLKQRQSLDDSAPREVYSQPQVGLVEEAGGYEDGAGRELDISSSGNCSKLGVPGATCHGVEQPNLSPTHRNWKILL